MQLYVAVRTMPLEIVQKSYVQSIIKYSELRQR